MLPRKQLLPWQLIKVVAAVVLQELPDHLDFLVIHLVLFLDHFLVVHVIYVVSVENCEGLAFELIFNLIQMVG